MNTIASLLTLLSSISIVAITYWFTKRREREAEWRKEKLAYYKFFIESISGIIDGDDSPEGHKLFTKATNNLLLLAPQAVIEALNKFRTEISISNQNRTQEKHDQLLASLLLAIRKDIGILPADTPDTFKPIIWASGNNKTGK